MYWLSRFLRAINSNTNAAQALWVLRHVVQTHESRLGPKGSRFKGPPKGSLEVHYRDLWRFWSMSWYLAVVSAKSKLFCCFFLGGYLLRQNYIAFVLSVCAGAFSSYDFLFSCLLDVCMRCVFHGICGWWWPSTVLDLVFAIFRFLFYCCDGGVLQRPALRSPRRNTFCVATTSPALRQLKLPMEALMLSKWSKLLAYSTWTLSWMCTQDFCFVNALSGKELHMKMLRMAPKKIIN